MFNTNCSVPAPVVMAVDRTKVTEYRRPRASFSARLSLLGSRSISHARESINGLDGRSVAERNSNTIIHFNSKTEHDFIPFSRFPEPVPALPQ